MQVVHRHGRAEPSRCHSGRDRSGTALSTCGHVGCASQVHRGSADQVGRGKRGGGGVRVLGSIVGVGHAGVIRSILEDGSLLREGVGNGDLVRATFLTGACAGLVRGDGHGVVVGQRVDARRVAVDVVHF